MLIVLSFLASCENDKSIYDGDVDMGALEQGRDYWNEAANHSTSDFLSYFFRETGTSLFCIGFKVEPA